MAASKRSPTIRLNDGRHMPLLGLGTSKSPHEALVAAVCAAIDCGYRLIDCAYKYGNQAAVGEAIRAKIADGTVVRDELFVVGKLWNGHHRGEHMDECLQRSLEQLGLDYLDLFLMHFPMSWVYPGDVNADAVKDEANDYVDTWRRMQRYLADGRARSLGVSNFNAFQLARLLRECPEARPAVNQVEVHPYLANRDVIELCHTEGVAVTGYCCVGAADRASRKQSDPGEFPLLLRDPVLLELAGKYGKSCAQIALRYSLDQQVAVVPKSVTPARIRENLDVFDFELELADWERLLALDRGFRFMAAPYSVGHKYYPFRAGYSE